MLEPDWAPKAAPKAAPVALAEAPVDAGAAAAQVEQVQPFSPISSAVGRGVGSVVQREAQRIVALLPREYTKALRAYRDLVRNAEASELDDEEFFFAVVSVSIRVGHKDVVREVLNTMSRYCTGPSTKFFHSCLKLLSAKRMYEECALLSELFGMRMPEDRVVCSCVAAALLETGRCSAAISYIDRFVHTSGGRGSGADYSRVLRYLVSSGDWAGALQLVKRLLAEGLLPETVVLNRVLDCLVELRRLDAAEELLALGEGGSSGQPKNACLDVVSYNIVLKGCAQAGDLEGCFRLVARLTARGLEPDDITFGTLLDVCIVGNDLGRASEVVGKLAVSGCKINTVLYTSFIRGFVRSGNLERAMEVYGIMREAMREHPTKSPDLITYSILVKANCDVCNLETGLRLLSDMVHDGVTPDSIIFNHLIEGCCHTGAVEFGKSLFQDMIDTYKLQPTQFTLVTLVKLFGKCGMCNEAERFIDTMEATFGQKPTTIIYTCFMSGCIRHGQLEKAWRGYERMKGVGLWPDDTTLATLRAAFAQDGVKVRQLEYDASELKHQATSPRRGRCTEVAATKFDNIRA